MSTREIQANVEDLYGIGVSAALVPVVTVTDAVIEEVAAWQNRPLEPVYAFMHFHVLWVKIRDEGLVRNKTVHLPIGTARNSSMKVRGCGSSRPGAKFWLRAMN